MNKKVFFSRMGIAIGFPFFFYCCASSLLLPNNEDAQRSQLLWEDMNLEKLQAGHALYINKCGKCHYLYRPQRFTEGQWLKKLPDMKKEAKLDSNQYELISRYIFTMKDAITTKK